MKALDELKTLVTEKPLTGMKTETILCLDADDKINKVVHALNQYFAQDDNRLAVQLDFQGEILGYLNRQDFYREKTKSKHGRTHRAGFATSQGANILGEPAYEFFLLACPVEGCETLIFKIHYDESEPPRCPVHQDKILQIIT